MKEIIEFPVTPITEETFERQGWEKYEDDFDGNKFHYFVLPLPKDNPENDCMCLISSANDEWEDLDNIKDMRIHATMYPENATNLYKACVSGIRRQMY